MNGPLTQLHSGSTEWLRRLDITKSGWGYEEFDVAEYFLNTPRESVLVAMKFWMATTQSPTRRQPCYLQGRQGMRSSRTPPCGALLGDHSGTAPGTNTPTGLLLLTQKNNKESCATAKKTATVEGESERPSTKLQRESDLDNVDGEWEINRSMARNSMWGREDGERRRTKSGAKFRKQSGGRESRKRRKASKGCETDEGIP